MRGQDGLGAQLDPGALLKVLADPVGRSSVSRHDPSAGRDFGAALADVKGRHPSPGDDGLCSGRAGQRRPVEFGGVDDGLVFQARPVDAGNGPSGALGGDDIGPEGHVHDGQPRPAAGIGDRQPRPFSVGFAEDFAGHGHDAGRLAAVDPRCPEITAVDRGPSAVTGGHGARGFRADARVQGPPEGQTDLGRIEDEDVDGPAVRPGRFEVPAPDLESLDAGGDRFLMPAFGQVRRRFLRERRREGAEDEGQEDGRKKPPT